MLVDSSVARSFATIGWAHHLIQLCGGCILVADGVHSQQPGELSELRNIRNALQRQADQADAGSGLASRAVAAVHGLDQLIALTPNELTVVTLSHDEFEFAVRLQSRGQRTGNGVAHSAPAPDGSMQASRHRSPSRPAGRWPSPATTKTPSPCGTR
jgi:hypothetical protein